MISSTLRKRLALQHCAFQTRAFSYGPRASWTAFSVACSKHDFKDEVIKATAKSFRSARERTGFEVPLNSAVVVASRNLTTWLEDEEFMSKFIDAFSSGDFNEDFTVLSAAVEGVCISTKSSCKSRSGFSILQDGVHRLMPGIWDQRREGATLSSLPSISLPVSQFAVGSERIDVTVPLANTVFDNGRPSTLFASRWRRQSGGRYRCLVKDERTSQHISLPEWSFSDQSYLSLPLTPVTHMRKIVAGLGNIVRQVEVDGQAKPASAELEQNIHRILKIRSAETNQELQGPIGIWALVVPEQVANDLSSGDIQKLRAFQPEHTEHQVGMQASPDFAPLLDSGCHLHKLLSGGGGWGAKQGLLSLDPQTRHHESDEEDVESFIRSFNKEQSADGIVNPGSYIQFFTEQRGHAPGPAPVSLGTSPMSIDTPEFEKKGPVQVMMNQFGAVTAGGLYLKSCEQKGAEKRLRGDVFTKINVPNSFIQSYF